MSAEGGLRVTIGGSGADASDPLRIGCKPGSDVLFHPDEDLPFADRAVGVFVCGSFVHDLDRAALLHFLLECRRTLQPGGCIGIEARPDRPADTVGADASDPLRIGCKPGSDDLFHPDEDLPFADRAVAVFVCGSFVHDLDRAARLHFLLECRRTLQPGGCIRIEARPDRPADTVGATADTKLLSAMAGLTPAPDGLTKRDRQVRSDPLVSIAVPAYNVRFFGACLDSAMAQTYDNIEIVVCDDSPGSEIEAIIGERARASRFPIRYRPNPKRLRPRANFMRCLEEAQGEFVKFLCDDDLLAPTCVESLLDGFRRAPDIAFATSRRQRIDEQTCRLPDDAATTPIVTEDSVIGGLALANLMLSIGINWLGEPTTTLFRKADLIDQTPGYFRFDRAEGHGIIDMVTWTALLLKGDAVYLAEALSSFRIHPGQRQRDVTKMSRSAASLRELQQTWRDLKLDRPLAPDRIAIKPLPPCAGADRNEQDALGRPTKSVAAN